MCARSLRLSVFLIAVTLVAGLVIRFARIGLPPFVTKYGGSMLWALMIYWVVSTLLPRWSIAKTAALAGVITLAVECLKLYHAPGLDTFRLTLPGILLLGRIFSPWDIVAYWLAIAVGGFVDRRLRQTAATT